MTTRKQRRCFECGQPVHREVRDTDYPESGLLDVRLVNVPVWVCKNGHEELEIPAIKELHRLLAHMIIRQQAPLVGRDVRFLRKELGLTAKAFAQPLGVHETTISRWENSRQPIGEQNNRLADLSVRFVAATLASARSGEPFPADLLPLLEQLESARGRMTFEHVDLGDAADSTSMPEWRPVPGTR